MHLCLSVCTWESQDLNRDFRQFGLWITGSLLWAVVECGVDAPPDLEPFCIERKRKKKSQWAGQLLWALWGTRMTAGVRVLVDSVEEKLSLGRGKLGQLDGHPEALAKEL